MFLTGPLAYLQLQKTGCTHTAMLLQHVCGGQQIGKHERMPEEMRNRVRFILGSVRNPWDWYVSAWAFGCRGKAYLYHKGKITLVDRGRPPWPRPEHPRADMWHHLYADVENPALFREWLGVIHDPVTRGDVAPDYAASPASDGCGLMTFAYAYLYVRHIADLFAPEIASPARLQSVIDHNILDCTIRTESLESDLVGALAHCGIHLRDEHLAFIYSTKRTNSSVRRQASYYYDAPTRDFVAARDRFVIERYAYAAPEA